MHSSAFKISAFLIFLGLLTSCGDGIEETLPEPEPTNNRMECKVNGEDWSAKSLVSLDSFGLFQVTGSNGLQSLQIGLFENDLAPGIYSLGGFSPVAIQFIKIPDGFNSEANGRLDLLVNTPQVIAGRFNVSLKSLVSGNTVNLTQGEFYYEKE